MEEDVPTKDVLLGSEGICLASLPHGQFSKLVQECSISGLKALSSLSSTKGTIAFQTPVYIMFAAVPLAKA